MNPGLVRMSCAPHPSAGGMVISPPCIASRRGSQNPKPLSVESIKLTEKDDIGLLPRTSRSHLLAGLRTAPKSASAATFPNRSNSPPYSINHTRDAVKLDVGNDSINPPKTAMPQFKPSRQQGLGSMHFQQQRYTPEQVLAPPDLRYDQLSQLQVDPTIHAQLLAANAYLSQQQQALQQQLLSLQVATQQFQGMNVQNVVPGSAQILQNSYQQQQQLANLQQQMNSTHYQFQQPNVFVRYDVATGQPVYYVDQSRQHRLSSQLEHSNDDSSAHVQTGEHSRLRYLTGDALSHCLNEASTPSAESSAAKPLSHFTSGIEHFRSHKKALSLANYSKGPLAEEESTKNPLNSATFPLTPLNMNSAMPGQARAGEHPYRQPRGPPSFEELASKPTSKCEGSKNFAARTRRSAVNNLLRAGLERRKEARSSGTISPVFDIAEDTAESQANDNDNASIRSGSGSLVGDDDTQCSVSSSCTNWGAIGSDRPSSRRNASTSSRNSNTSAEDERSHVDHMVAP